MGQHPTGCRSGLLNQVTSAALEAFIAHYFARHPVNATFTGQRAFDAVLPDWTRASRDAEVRELSVLHAALFDASPVRNRATLASDVTALDAELARANIDVRILETDSRFFHDKNPVLWTGEAIFSIVALLLRPTNSIDETVQALCARLLAIPQFLSDLPLALTEPTPPQWTDRAVREATVFAQFLRRELTLWCSAHHVVDAAQHRLAQCAEQAAAAFTETASWLNAQPRVENASCAIGKPAYTQLLQRGHFCDLSVDALLERAMSAMPAAQARYAELKRTVADSPEAFAEALAADRATDATYYDTFTAQFSACRQFAAQHDLVEWPDWPLQYVPIPEWARTIAPQLYFLFYRSPAPYEPRPVHQYLVTPVDDSIAPEERERRLRAWNHSTITLNHVVHHGALGHHVQNGHATHRSHSRIGRIAAVDCASRIGMFLGGSMAEGWACYATELADELGFLTPLERAAEQQSRVRMLSRAIVDMQLHTGGMCFADAVRFYEQQVGMPPAAASAEASKNSMFPATAVMYWLGTQGILDVRATMRERDGFTPRRFHDALLSRGSIPVALAAELLLTEPQP